MNAATSILPSRSVFPRGPLAPTPTREPRSHRSLAFPSSSARGHRRIAILADICCRPWLSQSKANMTACLFNMPVGDRTVMYVRKTASIPDASSPRVASAISGPCACSAKWARIAPCSVAPPPTRQPLGHNINKSLSAHMTGSGRDLGRERDSLFSIGCWGAFAFSDRASEGTSTTPLWSAGRRQAPAEMMCSPQQTGRRSSADRGTDCSTAISTPPPG